jgi:hypothetical protein
MYLSGLETKKEIVKKRNSHTGMSGYCSEVQLLGLCKTVE